MREIDKALAAGITAAIEEGPLDSFGITGVYRGRAPEGSAFPYVIFQQSAGRPTYALSRLVYKTRVYIVKAVDDGDDQNLAADIDAALELLLVDNRELTFDGYTLMYLRRDSDIEYPERHEGITYQHVGGMYRVLLSV